MKCLLQCPTIQQFGAGVLANVSLQTQEVQSAVAGKVRGIQAALEGMRAHPLQGQVLHFSVAALWNLTWNHEENATALITKLEDMPFIIERANHFSGHRQLTEKTCGLLDALCQFAPLRKPILSAKATTTLAVSIDNHEGSNKIQEYARGAMTNLLKRP